MNNVKPLSPPPADFDTSNTVTATDFPFPDFGDTDDTDDTDDISLVDELEGIKNGIALLRFAVSHAEDDVLPCDTVAGATNLADDMIRKLGLVIDCFVEDE